MVLFVLYMVLVFLIFLNVLIAIVCDNYDFALIKTREYFSCLDCISLLGLSSMASYATDTGPAILVSGSHPRFRTRTHFTQPGSTMARLHSSGPVHKVLYKCDNIVFFRQIF